VKKTQENVTAFSLLLPFERGSFPATLLHLCSEPGWFISVPVEAIPG